MTPPWVANFDSASAMVRAVGAALDGRSFERLGQPAWMGRLTRSANVVPMRARRELYRWAGWAEAVAPQRLDEVSWEAFGQWIASLYPGAMYPAALLGSSNGAAVHLASALGAPWLPQTFLVPVRRHGDPDDPAAALRFGERVAPALLERERDLQLHHMHDPNQDRLMVAHMTYLRLKGRALSDAYRRFLRERLAPGAPIVLLDCTATWPVTRVGDRHWFQFGAVGGIPAGAYHQGDASVAHFLSRQGSLLRRWDSPPADHEAPEAEWGFEAALREDVMDYADVHGHPVHLIRFDRPAALSPLVADLHQRWFDDLGRPTRRLLVETFILQAPRWALRAPAVPFWLPFAVEPAVDDLRRFLAARRDRFDEAVVTLFPHGVRSAGHAAVQSWHEALDGIPHLLAGVDEQKHPADFASFARYHPAVEATAPAGPAPPPLDVDRAPALVAALADGGNVEHRVLLER